jgi:uridine monophosphate synthetase
VENQGFFSKLNRAVQANRSLLCLGLDPEVAKFSADFLPDRPTEERLEGWCRALIEQTRDYICCVKPNIAFFEQYGPEGLKVLQRVIASVPENIPVLLDAKRGDIGSTAAAYARAIFDVYQAGAVTVSPYLGKDAVDPFLAFPGKAVFVLCQTSNPSAGEVQNHGAVPLYQHVAKQAQTWGSPDQVAFVVGATWPESLAQVRRLAPQSWILAPGVGAQGGDLAAALQAGLRADGLGMILPVSRAVIYAADPREAARSLRDRINDLRQSFKPQSAPSPKTDLVLALFEAGCVKFGNFTLASGKQSPIYVDLRRIISKPDLLCQAAGAYAALASALQFDCLAAIPYAALPVTAAVALKMNKPMLYPRKEAKTHGTGQMIEGAFEKGNVAVAIEDVITSGGSILTAVKTLEEGGLVVKDVIVLVDRNQGGRQAMADGGYRLHAVLTIAEIVETLHDCRRLDESMYRTVKQYLDASHAG